MTSTARSSSRTRWFSLSLTFTAVYSILALQQAFSSNYVVQDDARQHVFWMLRFADPTLFSNDLIADYFQTVAPTGYKLLYQAVSALGINPLLFNKLLPFVLNIVTASYCFGVCLRLFPVPAAAFCSTLLLSQSLGLTDAVVSGTPKAFIYPLFLAFIYYLIAENLWLCLMAIALLGLFYPQMVFIAVVTLTLRLFVWREGRLRLAKPRHRLFWGAGLGVAVLVLLPYALRTDQYGPVISVTQARSLPEFLPGGRSRFFYDDDPEKYWLRGRGGVRITSILTPVTNAAGFLLLPLPKLTAQFPLVRQLRRDWLLLQVVAASLIMFFAAHALLFKLHLPSRYTEHSLRIVISIAAGMVLVILIDGVFRWAGRYHLGWRTGIAFATSAVISIALLFYPAFVEQFPITAYKVGTVPSLYEWFQKQPNDSLIASLTDESNNLPTFAQRSILVGGEYAIPYHWGYYRQFRQRTLELITAQYTLDPQVLRSFLQKYGIDYWLIKPGDFTPDAIALNPWLMQYQPAANEAIAHLQQGEPALARTVPRCTVFTVQDLVVLEASCILNVD